MSQPESHPPASSEDHSTTTPHKSKLASLKQKYAQNSDRAKLLESFWKLAEYGSPTRFTGMRQIVTYFGQHGANDAAERDYILKRLIRGLASNRKCARLGFSCALAELLTTYPDITLDELTLISHTDQQQSSQEQALTSEETRNMHIGHAFIYLAFIQSGRLAGLSKPHLQKLLQNLNETRHKPTSKFYVRHLYTHTLTQLLKSKSLSNDQISEILLPIIDSDLKSGWNDPNSDTRDNLHLLLALINNYPNAIERQILDKFWLGKNLLLANEDKLYELISSASESLPTLHPFLTELLHYALNSAKFGEFWSRLVDERLCGQRRDGDKKFLAFKMWLFCVANARTSAQIDAILSRNLVHAYVHNYVNRGTKLHEMVHQNLHRNLVEIVRKRDAELSGEGVSPAASIAAKFMAVGVDIVKLGDLISSLLSVANHTGLTAYFGDIVRISADFGHVEHEAEMICLVNQLAAFTKSEAIFGDAVLLEKVFVCLVGNAFHFDEANFDANSMLKWSGKSEKLDAMCRDALFKIISLAIVKNSRKMDEALLGVFGKIGETKFAFKNEKKNREQMKGCWAKMLGLMRKVMAKDTKEDMDVVAHTFFTILAFEAVRFFDSFKESAGVIEDLEKAYEKAIDAGGEEKKKKGKGKKAKKAEDEDEPKWIDIIVEMLLSLYTLNSRWIRNAVGVVFKKLVPLMSENSVQLLLELLEPQADAELLVDEEIGDDAEENGKGEEEGADEDGESGIEEDDSDDDEDEGETAEDDYSRMNRLDEELRKAVNDALGDAAAQDSEQSDLDDDAMMQLDEALAQAFKARKRDKQRDVDVIQYKAKVLDLVQDVFRCTQRIDLIVVSRIKGKC